MSAVDPFTDPPALEQDLALLEALRATRKEFFDALVAASADRTRDHLPRLRQEAVYQMAEFFYLLKGYRLESGAHMRSLATAHNEHMSTLISDPDKLARLGLKPDRVQWAIFSDLGIEKLVENYALRGAFDQSDLARLLVELMSQESCRQVIATLARAGMVERVRSPYGAVLVRSSGRLEALFAHHLRDLRLRMTTGGRA